MMTLYSGTTDPFSQRCRIVLHEKGMDFQIIDVDMYNKPEDIAVMNPYNRLPVLVERDLILYESNIINEYIDERFPHPQLMPADPVMRARARLMLFNMEVELFSQIDALESGKEKPMEKARQRLVAVYRCAHTSRERSRPEVD
jgi:RNA polymerase-associated protein